jgi:5'-deoxynucleotidase YfbR-like HD superfamily hydrolase
MSKVILELYDTYKIMPQLAAHQLRVAAVAYAITQAIFEPIHDEELISACLLHDMGNILKFDLSVFPEFSEIIGRV